MVDPTKKSATYADLEPVPSHLVAEIIGGALWTRSHGHVLPAMARTALSVELGSLCQTRSNAKGSWQVLLLPELHFGEEVVVPDIAAWRVERLPFLPDHHLDLAPDWVCELTSDNQKTNPALESKLALYASLSVEHAWIIDLSERRLQVFRRDGRDWRLADTIDRQGCVSALPFDGISFSLADLWPLDPSATSENLH
ncbi:Uma2 family endonuclease [Allomesorhizobium camelthorni]|uniref:Uma2 family endonuclease n=1 Tax=Allomesorhizobium camelthorni TaxID=475069 RepID=A0A6G4WAM1_9HYPH|nr:Uma2 family endonuclease [Mesorhizobium camelthorni]NGO51286.1 Uma2 family endonuclease [Mesorhizobium camelthorni]